MDVGVGVEGLWVAPCPPAPRADFTRPAGTDRPYALAPRRAPPPGPISLGPKGPTAREGVIQNSRIIHCSALTVPLQLLVKTHQAEATGYLNSALSR